MIQMPSASQVCLHSLSLYYGYALGTVQIFLVGDGVYHSRHSFYCRASFLVYRGMIVKSINLGNFISNYVVFV